MLLSCGKKDKMRVSYSLQDDDHTSYRDIPHTYPLGQTSAALLIYQLLPHLITSTASQLCTEYFLCWNALFPLLQLESPLPFFKSQPMQLFSEASSANLNLDAIPRAPSSPVYQVNRVGQDQGDCLLVWAERRLKDNSATGNRAVKNSASGSCKAASYTWTPGRALPRNQHHPRNSLIM